MFSPGQIVYHKTRNYSGKVLDCDGETVYLMQVNGVETEFRRDELTTTPPPAGKAPEAVAIARLSRTLVAGDITAEHSRVLAIIPPRTLQTVVSLFERQPGAGRFSALDVAQKLNFIADVTAIPYRTMKEFSDRPGTLGLMMGRGLSVRSGSAT